MENYYGNFGLDRESKSILVDYFAVPKNRVDTIYEKYLASYPSEAITEVLKHLMLNSDTSPKLNVILELVRNKMNSNQEEDAFKILDKLFELNEHGKTFKERKVLVLTYFNSSFKGKFKYELVPFCTAEKMCKKYKTLINSKRKEFRVFVKCESPQEETIDVEKSKKFLHDLNAWINYLRSHSRGTRSVDEIIENKIVSSDFFNSYYETIEKYCKKKWNFF